MKRVLVTVILILFVWQLNAQCSICTKTASQLGERPAAALNNAIVYLMMTPLLIIGFVGYKWWKREKEIMKEEQSA
ncbi:MAG TPA: hypothetical protein PLU36_07865 [Chitinophagaceae bacterium]|nr:hypothetical protein [Chitinophagaceae bacterium]MCC6635497.1 hypothetical protein [Chitinophagaceae bacterium]HMZ46703.1 hypothetical protein [Chitinophagaceae bacterium]HNE93497.1 hypothetical protein [Chitinophagaceae bacterium]HNF29281.1 hypothetical protein [Chitinophagaceae bacterium]